MDNGASLSNRLGVTPGKLKLVCALAVMLVGVLFYQYSQYGSGSAAATAGDDGARRRGPASTRRPAQTPAKTPEADEPVEGSARSPGESINQALWQTPELASVIEYDPFALPTSFPQAARVAVGLNGLPMAGEMGAEGSESQLASLVEELQTQLEDLRQRGVTVIVKHRDKYVAMIGDRTVHVGDEINGFTVTAIEPSGVHVERKVQE